MDLHHLEYIVEIAKEENISKAAERLHISQPTLSIYLTKLEKTMGISLFRRKNNVLNITKEGKKYVDACSRILQIRDQLYAELYQHNQETLNIGVLSSSAPVFNHILQEFKMLYPQVALRPVVQKSQEIYEALLSGSIELGFVTSYMDDPKLSFPNVEIKTLREYELMLVISKSNPCYQKMDLSQGVLLEQDYALLESLKLTISDIPMIRKRVLEEILPALKMSSKKHIACMDNLEFLTTMLYLENYYCFTPYSRVPDDIALIPLNFHPMVKKIMIYETGKHFSDTERNFIRMVEEAFQEYPYYYSL